VSLHLVRSALISVLTAGATVLTAGATVLTAGAVSIRRETTLLLPDIRVLTRLRRVHASMRQNRRNRNEPSSRGVERADNQGLKTGAKDLERPALRRVPAAAGRARGGRAGRA
jgi:hypothetical protein